MRFITIAILSAFTLAPVAAQAATPLEKETSIWQAFKNKDAKAFGGMLAPDFVAQYEDGTFNRAHELDSLKNSTLDSFKISNFASRMIDADDMLMTYVVDVKGKSGKDDISGKYQAGSVWHRSGSTWLGVYHTEIKAK